MRLRIPAAVTAMLLLLVTIQAAPPASAVPGEITCTPATATTMVDTQVTGHITCASATGAHISYSLRKYVEGQYGPNSGKVSLTHAGAFTYKPGYYPPDHPGGSQDRMPDWAGTDNFTVLASADDGAAVETVVRITVDAVPKTCNPKFTAGTGTGFNDPSSSESKQYAIVRYIVDLIACTPARNNDGSQATIKFTFYSLTYNAIERALVDAANRGVSVQALTNSHAAKYSAWKALARALGPNTDQPNFAATCWAGCITPRNPPPANAPTAWYSAQASSSSSLKVTFTDRSIPGAAPIVGWHWDFGDGSVADGPGPFTHVYAAPGNYNTSLTVADANGASHQVSAVKTLPENNEPEYPSLHAKIYLFSQVGTGSHARSWVSAYSSGNPTYQQSRKGFNNFNIAAGDKVMYDGLTNYIGDLVRASKGQLMTPNYFRSFATPGNKTTHAPATTVHFGPQTVGDINRDILDTVKCKYKVGHKNKRTDIRVSMFVFTRTGVARDLWRLAFEKGCDVEVTYTQMSQRLKGPDGNWLKNEDGEVPGYGVADCLSTPPTIKVHGRTKPNTLGGPTASNPSAQYCAGGGLKGKVPKARTGMWMDSKSKFSGGRLRVRMSCPVEAKYDAVTRTWSLRCIHNDIFTHQKVMIVDGFIRGSAQKYVMSGSSNWSSPGLRSSDEIITELQHATTLYNQQYSNMKLVDKVVARNASRTRASSLSALSVGADEQLDVRGMTFPENDPLEADPDAEVG